MSIPDWIADYLDARGVPYRVHHHATAYTAEAVANRERVSGVQFGKVVVAITDGKPALLVMPMYGRVDPPLACAALAAHDFRLAREDEIARLVPESRVGAIPPLRHWPGIEIWMDPSLKHEGEFVFQAGTHEDVIHMDFSDWFRIAEPKIASFVHPTFIGA